MGISDWQPYSNVNPAKPCPSSVVPGEHKAPQAGEGMGCVLSSETQPFTHLAI